MIAVTLQARFAEVAKPDDGCWLWKWARNGAGRANFRGRSAPRQVYEMVFECKVAAGLGVLHSCDNPLCVNPSHLRVGTQKDNMRECATKGRRSPNSRQRPGEEHSLAKLTWADVERIRALAAAGTKHQALASQYPVNRRQISRIVRGERWSKAA